MNFIFMAEGIRLEKRTDEPLVEQRNAAGELVQKGYSLEIVDGQGKVVARIVHDYGGLPMKFPDNPNRFIRAWIETDLDVRQGPRIDTWKPQP